MYRQPPVLSPILQARERLKQDAYMKKRLKSVTCSVDFSCPKAYASGWHKRPNRKKIALERDRKMLIEQDNRLLLQRISHIMQHNHLDQHASTRKYTSRMSNIGGRRAELSKINTTNKIILERLNKTTAYYDNSIAAKDWKVYRKHLEHMGTYAYKGGGKMNGSVQNILKRGLKGTRRAATASGRRRANIGNLSSQVRGSLPRNDQVSSNTNKNANQKKKKTQKKKKKKRLRPITSPIKTPSTHSL